MRRYTVALIAAALFGAVAISCQNGSKENGAKGKDSTVSSTVASESENAAQAGRQVVFPEGSLKIVWVNMDSLLAHYDYYFDQQREMGSMTSQAEKELQTKGQSLERRVATFQDNVQKGLMTRSEAQKEQEALQVEQGRFLQLQEQHRQRLMEEEQVRTRRVTAAITEFIQKYNKEHGYDFILSGPMLYGAPALNVTNDVLLGLNEEYAAQRKANAAKDK